MTHDVYRKTPDVLATVKPGGMTLTAFLAARGQSEGQREVRYGHVLGSPASLEAIHAWGTQHPSHPLPADLEALVARVNGIHLWANLETGRSYEGIAPIEEWDLARVKMFGAKAPQSLLDDRYLAISYHSDGGAFIVLDVDSGKYYLMDPAGPNETVPFGSSVEELLDWCRENRRAPRG